MTTRSTPPSATGFSRPTRRAPGRAHAWGATPDGALALVILLDQFPRNMFRGAIRCPADPFDVGPATMIAALGAVRLSAPGSCAACRRSTSASVSPAPNCADLQKVPAIDSVAVTLLVAPDRQHDTSPNGEKAGGWGGNSICVVGGQRTHRLPPKISLNASASQSEKAESTPTAQSYSSLPKVPSRALSRSGPVFTIRTNNQ